MSQGNYLATAALEVQEMLEAYNQYKIKVSKMLKAGLIEELELVGGEVNIEVESERDKHIRWCSDYILFGKVQLLSPVNQPPKYQDPPTQVCKEMSNT